MKIEAATIYVVPTGNRRAVMLELETDSGLSGIGEAGVAYGAGITAAAEMTRALVERFVLGQDPSRIESIWSNAYDGGFWTKGGGAISSAGLSAIDHALLYINGKRLGVPAFELLGGLVNETLPVYANGWWGGCDSGEQYAESGAATVARGYGGLKLYPLGVMDASTVVRHPAHRALDGVALARAVERVAVLRERVGPDIDIMLDITGGLAMDLLLPLLHRLEPFALRFVEEPVDPAMPELLARVATATRIPLAAGERVYLRYGFHRLLQTGAVAVIQPDVCNTGGLMEAKKIAAMAEVYNVRVAPHNYGSTLATAIAVQLGACIPNFMVLECFPDFAAEPGYLQVLETPLETTVVDGRMPVPTAPGLGVLLHKTNVAPHRWWRGTLSSG